ncbi:MAG: molecular chaperone HtpG [Proteobacteria bacterium]|mgnify:FL=1|jgi:molecular chaperone HtpG|nr:molecular chaperone HtpG [Pseudomonadota bacterium]MDP6135586.1 molecular chaperone HtpG [Arenicellales bacterium]MDP7221213.1 molecular chaperone HtpG [Arenicellales bacterium]HCF74248.1 molecular chaperone HtpG [Gammaproteobacteria bacterium]HJP11752.1 molecular chaperone HtpG [Arenicellales bacterium]|tara:strand:+ start:227 stop:2116 length:1890 start_codon:yes stop_codon:yes gene_type:complete
MATDQAVERHSFQTEVTQLLHLMIHSLYSNKEIFLRELISNGSDACDRLRFSALTEESLMESGDELSLLVSVDKKAKTITVRDNGIGMTREEVVENIGTIARSGTRQFLDSLSGDQSADARLIGQFGVGFYSVFLVADKVELVSRRAGEAPDQGVRWTSDGSGEYTIENIERADRGTEITLHLRKDDEEFADAFRLRSIIGKYSDHISLPIRMPDEDEKKKEELETVNKGSALWARAKSEISEEEYNQFYSTISYDTETPLATLHNRVEGNLEYISLLFIPSKAPFDLWDREQRHGINLYVRRIFILDDAKYLMPSYLRFVRGVVDAADLPLNVSREYLQDNKDIERIRNASVKKILAELKRLADKEPEEYARFWKEYGKVLKEGLVEDHDNQKTLADLLRFSSTHGDNDTQDVSLTDYVKRMPMKQKGIYFITADSHSAASSSPHLEIFRKNDIEVLLLSDPVDEWLVTSLNEYDDKTLKSVAKGALDLDDFTDDEKKKESQEREKDLAGLVEKIEKLLGEKVKSVRVSHRLTDSPACLVADEQDLGGNLERILQSMGQEAPEAKPIMEINPDHPLIRQLTPEHDKLEEWSMVLFDQAALSEGAKLSQPAAYVQRVNDLLTRASLLAS